MRLPSIRCLLGFHDAYALAHGHENEAPHDGHPCRPLKNDLALVTLAKFTVWTRQRCHRCGWGYPPVRAGLESFVESRLVDYARKAEMCP